jgi:hypothetical protein
MQIHSLSKCGFITLFEQQPNAYLVASPLFIPVPSSSNSCHSTAYPGTASLLILAPLLVPALLYWFSRYHSMLILEQPYSLYQSHPIGIAYLSIISLLIGMPTYTNLLLILGLLH